MKKLSGVLVALLMFLVCSVPPTAQAGDLGVFSPAQQKILKSTGVPVYPGATYTSGDNEIATVMWFGTKDSPDKIIDWYKSKLSGWSEMTVNGSRILYKGSGKIEAKDLNTRAYLWARNKNETTGDTDVEITIRIPK